MEQLTANSKFTRAMRNTTGVLNLFKGVVAKTCLVALLFPTAAYSNSDEALVSSAGITAVSRTEESVIVEYKAVQMNRVARLFSPTLQFKSAAGTPAYFQEVFDHHCRAARTGDANGYYVMGMLYMYGSGTKKNLSMSSTLLYKAADMDHEKAKEVLEVLPRSPEVPELPACLTSASGNNVAGNSEPIQFYKRDGKIHQLVSRLAPRYGIDTDLAMAVIAVESGFNPRATSPKNAQGLMQLIPDTASRYRVADAYDPEQNVKGGLSYLRWLMDQFEGNVGLVVAAYNAGEKTIEKYGGIPPYPETQEYVQKIRALYPKNSHPYRDHMGRVISNNP